MMRFVVFKQKTAYEVRISDWSSDVCSSDLRFLRQLALAAVALVVVVAAVLWQWQDWTTWPWWERVWRLAVVVGAGALAYAAALWLQRSDARRVGQEFVSTCRSRWSPAHKKKHRTTGKED